MFDWLISIPGPQFLWIFPFVVASITLAVLGLYRLDPSLFEETPVTPRLNTLDIAILSGGDRQAIQLALFELYREGCIFFDDKNRVKVRQPPETMLPPLLPLGRKLFKKAANVKYLSSLSSGSTLKEICKSCLDPVTQKLQDLHLIKSAEDLQREFVIFLLGMFAWSAFGGAKLFFGLTRNKPSSFLVMELLAALVIYSLVTYPRKQKPTSSGRRILSQLRGTLQTAQSSFMTTGKSMEVQPTLLMAVFGVMAFNHTPYVKPFQNAYFADPTSSSSGGCGSSGCGGGGGCGGGCGGCGGS